MEPGRLIYWVDDLRDPKDFLLDRKKGDTVFWLKDYESFVRRVIDYGVPDVIWLDHDLGKDKSGKDCASFLVDYCLDHALKLPDYHSQSQNPVGKENIVKLFESYNKFYKENIEDGNLH